MKNKVGLITSFEFKQLIKTKSYKITTVVFFVLALLGAFVPRLIQGNLFKSITDEFNKTQKLGVIINDDSIDESELKSFLSNYEVHLYTDEEKLKDDVLSKELDRGAIIDSDSIQKFVLNSKLTDMGDGLDRVLNEYRYKKLIEAEGMDYSKVKALEENQYQINEVILGKDSKQNYFIIYILLFLLYMIILTYGQITATSVAKEKNDRTMELLITSTKPKYLILSKVLATVLSAVIQVSFLFIGFGLGYLFNKEYWSDIFSITSAPIQLVITFILFMIAGFFLYLFIFATLGALVNKIEEVSQSISSATLLIVLAYFGAIFALTTGSESSFVTFLSYFPLTSPFVMFIRAGMLNISIIEIAASFAILVVSAYFIYKLACDIYRLGTLQYGNRMTLKQAFKALREDKKTKSNE
ncbi:MAG: ABC transporter permease [Eubacteriales bacterium]|uniref:ABC transporter permease n=1 Tax=Fenollaria sp. TaxID=1965292 RepID=UPI002A751C9B|nr:ABC transporter permease [Fenollaria sp.]MDD7339170.1 ABC transporter permease [Eubacteriales bacterium]MDY3106166.1 ABC transporter permease [Fenollaria sp.]